MLANYSQPIVSENKNDTVNSSNFLGSFKDNQRINFFFFFLCPFKRDIKITAKIFYEKKKFFRFLLPFFVFVFVSNFI